jgi:hypothetical protein
MDGKKVAAKAGITGGYGAVGVILEHLLGQVPALKGLPPGTITAAVVSLLAAAKNWWTHRHA